MVERRSGCEAPACSSHSEREESPDRDDSRCRSESGSPDRPNRIHGSASDSPDRLNEANEGSQDNASNLAAALTGQPQRPASDSSNQSTDAEQHFSGSRPSWQTRVDPRQQATTTTTTTTDADGYHSPTRLSLPKPPKRRHAQESSSGNDSDGGCSMDDGAMNEAVGKISKKQRLHWSAELHTRFMSAVHHLGIDTAVPKNILQLMNVEGMTRDNVASHLQKYRLHLKRLAGVGPNDPIPPHLIPQVQAEAMRLHKAKQQQEAFQMRMLQEHRSRQDRGRQTSDAAAAAAPQHHHHQPASPSTSSPSSPEAPPTRLFPPLVIDHESAAGQPPFHPFAQPAPSLHAARGHEGHGIGGGKKAAAAHGCLQERGGGGCSVGGGGMQGLLPAGSASMDAVQLGYTLGLMQGASQPWKSQQQYPSHLVGPSHPSLLHLPPHLQAQLFDPAAAAAAAMASSLQQQQQQQQQPTTTSSGLSLASLAALQQMYCMQQPYGAAFMVQPNAASLMSQGDSMYGLQPNGMWPVRSVFPPGGPYHPPC